MLLIATATAILLGGIGSGIALNRLIASIDVVGWLLEGDEALSAPAVAALAGLLLIALAAVVLAIAGAARARRTSALILVAVSLLLPIGSLWIGLQSGGRAFEAGLLKDARTYAGQLDPDRVSEMYDAAERMGVVLPGEEKVLEILDEAQNVGGSGEDSPQGAPAAGSDGERGGA